MCYIYVTVAITQDFSRFSQRLEAMNAVNLELYVFITPLMWVMEPKLRFSVRSIKYNFMYLSIGKMRNP